MKNKTTAGLLAIFGGWIGIHRFYLGQTGLGLVYFFFSWFFLIPFFVSLIDAIVILSMSDEQFDRKYNRKHNPARNRDPRYDRRTTNRQQRPQRRSADSSPPKNYRPVRKNPYFDTAMKKYQDYDMKGAIEDFTKSLSIDPHNPKAHYFLACAYSLTEDAEKGFYHLSKAVSSGMKNKYRIREQDELAFLRIQDEFENFEKAGYRLNPSLETKKEEIPTMDDDLLLSQLNKLRELRERGLLTEEEFIQEKRKLKA